MKSTSYKGAIIAPGLECMTGTLLYWSNRLPTLFQRVSGDMTCHVVFLDWESLRSVAQVLVISHLDYSYFRETNEQPGMDGASLESL